MRKNGSDYAYFGLRSGSDYAWITLPIYRLIHREEKTAEARGEVAAHNPCMRGLRLA